MNVWYEAQAGSLCFFPPFSAVGWLDVNKHREIGTKPNVMLPLHSVLARSDKLRYSFSAGSSPVWHV